MDLLDRTGGLDVLSLRCAMGLGQTVAYRRLGRLQEHGMVRAFRPFHGTPALYIPTRRGLREVLGLEEIEPPSVSMSSYNHQVQVGRVIAQLESANVTWEASRITRRRQRAAAAAGDFVESRRYSLSLSWLERSHLSDALIWPSETSVATEQPVALEVELTQKSGRRLDEILEGYALQLSLVGVVYICAPGVEAAVSDAAERGQHRDVVNITTLASFGPGVEHGGRGDSDRTVTTSWMSRYLAGSPLSEIERYFRGGGTQLAAPTLPGF